MRKRECPLPYKTLVFLQLQSARSDRSAKTAHHQNRPCPTGLTRAAMCRNIKNLFNFEPPATEAEIRDASLQFVRKICGFTRPSKANELAFERAVEEVTASARAVIRSLVTTAEPRNREVESEKLRARSAARFGPKQ